MQEAWELMCKYLLEFKAECEARGIPLVAFDIPCRLCMCDWNWAIVQEIAPGVPYERTVCERKLREFFREAGFDYIETLEPFQRHPDPDSLYFRLDGHLTPEGTRFLAELISDHLYKKYGMPDDTATQ